MLVTPSINGAHSHPVIQGLCLDLDGTLYNRRAFWWRMIWSLLKMVWAGRFSLKDLQLLYRIRENMERARQWGHRVDLSLEIAEEVAAVSGCTVEQVLNLLEYWTDYLQPQVLSGLASPELRHLLTRIRLRGYRLSVYSDYPVHQKLEAMGLPLTLFDAVVVSLSPDVAALKPHPAGFKEACARMGLEPTSVLFLGDRQETDGMGARLAGMPFARCRNFSPFTRQSPAMRYLLRWEKNSPVLKEAMKKPSSNGCWVCGSHLLREHMPSRIPLDLDSDLVKVTDSRYGVTACLLQCEDCGFIQAEAQSASKIEGLYRGLVDEEYKASSDARRFAFEDLLKRVREQRPYAVTLLDIGAGTGILCGEARKAGFEAEGVEPSAWSVAEARRQDLLMHEGYFPHPDVDGRQFDVVTICDVIEHVSCPADLLQAARRCLAPDGLLVIVTPDVDSWAARLMGRRWWHFRPAHIGYFTTRTMAAVMASSGFSLERVESYVWRFPISYLMVRVGSYLPISTLTGRLLKIRRFARLWNLSIPLNLFDSHIYFARQIGDIA